MHGTVDSRVLPLGSFTLTLLYPEDAPDRVLVHVNTEPALIVPDEAHVVSAMAVPLAETPDILILPASTAVVPELSSTTVIADPVHVDDWSTFNIIEVSLVNILCMYVNANAVKLIVITSINIVAIIVDTPFILSLNLILISGI